MRAYFPFTFIVENQSYCCIWYSDSVDGFIMKADKIKYFTHLAHSSEFSFYGDHNTKILTAIYDKLFIGSQLPAKEAGNSLNAPVWDKGERLELTKVIEDGLKNY